MGLMPSSLFSERQLHITRPQHGRVFARQIAAQQIMPSRCCAAFSFCLSLKREPLFRDRFVRRWQTDLHKAESRPASFFAAPIRNSN